MKQNTFTKLMAAGVAGAFALGTAFAQDNQHDNDHDAPPARARARPPVQRLTTTTTSHGRHRHAHHAFAGTEYIMTVRTSTSAEPTTYYYTQDTRRWLIRRRDGADVGASPRHAGDLHLCQRRRSHGRSRNDAAEADHLLREKTTTTTTTTNP